MIVFHLRVGPAADFAVAQNRGRIAQLADFLQLVADVENGAAAVGERLRGMMPWIAENKLVDKEKN